MIETANKNLIQKESGQAVIDNKISRLLHLRCNLIVNGCELPRYSNLTDTIFETPASCIVTP